MRLKHVIGSGSGSEFRGLVEVLFNLKLDEVAHLLCSHLFITGTGKFIESGLIYCNTVSE